MTGFEVALLAIQRFAVVGIVFSIILGIGLVIGAVFYLVALDKHGDDKIREKKEAILIMKTMTPLFFIALLLALFPSADDMWKVRLSALKLTATHPEMIEKYAKEGMPYVQKVMKKIECKYLGCTKEEQPK